MRKYKLAHRTRDGYDACLGVIRAIMERDSSVVDYHIRFYRETGVCEGWILVDEEGAV